MGLWDQLMKVVQDHGDKFMSYAPSGDGSGSGNQGGGNQDSGQQANQNTYQSLLPTTPGGYTLADQGGLQGVAPAAEGNPQQGQGQPKQEQPKAADEKGKEDEKKNENKQSNYEQYLENAGRELGATYNPTESYLQNSIFGRGIINALGTNEVNKRIAESEQQNTQEANKQQEINQSAQAAGLPESAANTIGNIPLYQLLVPKEERDKQLEDAKSGVAKAGDDKQAEDSDNKQAANPTAQSLSDEDFQKLWGLSQDDYNKLEQGDQFRKALENGDLGKYYQDTYGIGGDMAYEQWRDIGQTNDYQGKHDLVRDVLGLGEDSSKAIPEWLELYGNSGIDINRGENNERDEQIIQDVMDYMWGADNIINPYLWAENENNYAATHSLGGEGTAARLGEYFAENYYPNNGENYFQQFRNPETGEALFPQLDNKDLGIIAMAQNLANKDLKGFGQDNIDQIAAILNGAGDNASFSFLDDNEEGGINRASQSKYNLRDLLQATSNYALPYDVYGANGEAGVNSPIWSKVADDIMADIARATNKGIKRN